MNFLRIYRQGMDMGKQKTTLIGKWLETNEPSPRESTIRPCLSRCVAHKFNHLEDESRDAMYQSKIEQRSQPSSRLVDGNQFDCKLMIIFCKRFVGIIMILMIARSTCASGY